MIKAYWELYWKGNSYLWFKILSVSSRECDSSLCFANMRILIVDPPKKGALGVEPRAYRTAADCSTTELYPLSGHKLELCDEILPQ